MFVRPTEGSRVIDPSTGAPIPELGAEVPESSYFVRRLQRGDLALAEPTDSLVVVETQIHESEDLP